MGTNQIPQFVIGFKAFLGGKEVSGAADVELPKLEFMSESVSGAGYMGESEVQVAGYLKPMSATIKLRLTTADAAVLAKSGTHEVDFRSADQSSDSNGVVVGAQRYTLRGSTKVLDLGKLAVGKAQDTSFEMSVTYLKFYRDGAEVLEVDQANHVYRVNGKDDENVANIRKALGL